MKRFIRVEERRGSWLFRGTASAGHSCIDGKPIGGFSVAKVWTVNQEPFALRYITHCSSPSRAKVALATLVRCFMKEHCERS